MSKTFGNEKDNDILRLCQSPVYGRDGRGDRLPEEKVYVFVGSTNAATDKLYLTTLKNAVKAFDDT